MSSNYTCPDEFHMLHKLLFLLVLLVHGPLASADNPLMKLESLDKSSLLLVDPRGSVVYSKQARQAYIPASTIKILTALIAMNTWGGEHQFSTRFYFDSNTEILWVQGLGDPFLISEELDRIIQQIKAAGVTSIRGIGVDETYFDREIYFDGRGNSSNPYDAPANALAVNFNTLQLRIKDGKVLPGEKQTPITPMAEILSQGLPAGEHRINLKDADRSARYFTEVLSAKLKAAGVEVGNAMSQSKPENVKLILDYKNSHGVAEVVSAMLLYSNNFIANQLYLMLGAEKFGPPATLEKAQQAVAAFIHENFEWQNYRLVDGSGLSRKNRLSAQQLIDILGEFEKHRALLPKQNASIFAKSGTLKGISTYAGYINRQQAWWPFALMINQQVDYTFRERLAQQLLTVPR